MADGGRPGFSDVSPKSRKPTSKANDKAGHRERLRKRFTDAGPGALADYEILEMYLFLTKKQGDTKPTAKALLKQFGSISAVLAAPAHLLKEVPGVGPETIVNLKLAQAIAQRTSRDEISTRPVLSSWGELVDYCRAHMAHEEVEQFRILFLDKKNRLIRDEVQQVGTVDHTPVYPREVIKRALELNATALILAHNHPSGDPQPSSADLQMTRAIIDIAQPLGIVVHDHIIIGRNGHISMKSQKLI